MVKDASEPVARVRTPTTAAPAYRQQKAASSGPLIRGDHVSFRPLWVFGALCEYPPFFDALVRHAFAALKGSDGAE